MDLRVIVHVQSLRGNIEIARKAAISHGGSAPVQIHIERGGYITDYRIGPVDQ